MKKDTERHEELMNMKKAWETLEAGRAQKAFETRQKFLESLQPKLDDETKESPENRTEESIVSTVSDSPETTVSSPLTSAGKRLISSSTSKKGSIKNEMNKQSESPVTPSTPIAINEPLLNEPPPMKPKILLPPLDLQPYLT